MEKPKDGAPNGADDAENASLKVPDKDVNMIIKGSNSIYITLSKKALKMLQAGYSYPVDMIKGESKVRFVIVAKETFDSMTVQFAEKMMRERISEFEGLGKDLADDVVVSKQDKKGDKH